ncbi:unnamed protein product [Acanthoscelides obtectus]|uniref:Uncharacterized protein n=1 Tax=Acanthoscelides obtectus TaxID=200917 RepID=A0A9P0LP48_ACAOB|nr:unnamed protein product [Acanthoscelides obtectus]CAK1668590.1 hypothetical protein AOBTE_LOCUS26503 [Acanthoscelides obtectus]
MSEISAQPRRGMQEIDLTQLSLQQIIGLKQQLEGVSKPNSLVLFRFLTIKYDSIPTKYSRLQIHILLKIDVCYMLSRNIALD